jgi:uncharacterized membrane protein
MKKSSHALNFGIASIVAAGVLLANTAHAVPSTPAQWEKCAGVAIKGLNDCGALDGKHACAGQATTSHDSNEWVYTPEGTCAKIGGIVAKVVAAK